jgi:hypothetical protein
MPYPLVAGMSDKTVLVTIFCPCNLSLPLSLAYLPQALSGLTINTCSASLDSANISETGNCPMHHSIGFFSIKRIY